MMCRILAIAFSFAAAFHIFAAPLTFDVASVKISKAPDAVMYFASGAMDSASGRFRVPSIGGNVTMTNWSLGSLIAAAWDLGAGQMSGPAWLNSERYDIAAKTSPLATQDQLRAMLQSLLAERFGLVIHRETKQAAIFSLVVAKTGPKLRPASGDERLPVLFAPPSRFIGQGSTMQTLALALSRPAGRKVLDKTGIVGAFDFTLTFSTGEAGVDSGPSIFTALQEQLGLRLEPDQAPVEVLVVDRAEKVPTPN